MSLLPHQQFYEIIQGCQQPLITFPKNATADTLAASLSLAQWLKRMNKKPEIVCPNFQLSPVYQFLPAVQQIKTQIPHLKNWVISINPPTDASLHLTQSQENQNLKILVTPDNGVLTQEHFSITPASHNYDLIITINTPDLDRLEDLFENNLDLFYHRPIINIDHSAENEHYGQLNLINLNASSASEIIYDLINQLDANSLDEAMATCLLTGLIEKTKSFKTSAVTPTTLNIASQLIAAGAQRESIVQNLYRNKSLGALKLWGRILLNLQTDADQKFAWAEIAPDDFQETQTSSDDLAGVIEELISHMPSVQLTTFFYHNNAETHCLIKSEGKHNLLSLFQSHRPQGRPALIQFPLTQTRQAILAQIRKILA